LWRNVLLEVLHSDYLEFDIKSLKWIKQVTALSDVNKWVRKIWPNERIFKLSEHANSESNHFRKVGPFGIARWSLNLRKYVYKQFRKQFVFQERIPFETPCASCCEPPTILLNLSSAIATSLSAITISTVRLHQLKFFPSHTLVVVRLYSTSRQRNPLAESSGNLGEIVRRVFLLLSDIYFENSLRTHCDNKIKIHFDGHGMPLYAILQEDAGQQKSMIHNRRKNTQFSDVARLVNERTARLKHYWVTARFKQDGDS
jgi:hypothetical protein